MSTAISLSAHEGENKVEMENSSLDIATVFGDSPTAGSPPGRAAPSSRALSWETRWPASSRIRQDQTAVDHLTGSCAYAFGWRLCETSAGLSQA